MSANYLDPITTPADKVWLAQHWSPGLVDIDGANSPRKWEELDGYGWSGSLLRFKGIGISHFTLRFRLYTPQDWLDWANFKPLVARPPRGVRPRALDIWHPILADQEIFSCVIEDCGQPTQSADGEWTIEIKCIEQRPLKYSLVTNDGSAATPADPYEEQVKQLNKEYADELAKANNPNGPGLLDILLGRH